MKIIFRCDSSFTIGSGHLFRCLNLAYLLDNEVTFICRNLPGNINSRVRQNQLKLIELSDNWSTLDAFSEEEVVLSIERPDIIIVDHYQLGSNWEVMAKKYCKKLIVIDDIEREHICTAIIDQNYRRYPPQVYQKSKARLFLGPKYCLLNKDFLKLLPPKRNFKIVNNVIVFFGGSDHESMTLRILDIIDNFNNSIKWDIIIGQQNRDFDAIYSKSKIIPNLDIYHNISNMHEFMLKADLFIGAGGTTTWERAIIGLPSIVISIAENQENVSRELNEQKAIRYIGKSSEISDETIKDQIKKTISNPSDLRSMSESCLNLKVSSQLNELVNFIKTF